MRSAVVFTVISMTFALSVGAQEPTAPVAPTAAAPAAPKAPDLSFQVVWKRNGQVMNLQSRAKWSFLEVAPGVKSLFAQVMLAQPSGPKIQAIRGAHLQVKPGWIKPDKLMLALGATATRMQITYEGGAQEIWTAELQMPKPRVVQNGCVQAGLNVVPASGAGPVFFGADCVVKENRVILTASVPGDMEWGETTIFETDGKGERWKVFEISRNNLIAGSDVFAVFGFIWRGQKMSFNVIQVRKKGGVQIVTPEQKKKKSEELRTRVDFGWTQFSGKTPQAEASSMSPLLGAQILTPEVLWGLRGLAGIRYAFPLSKGSFSEITGGAGKMWGNFNPGSSNYGVFGDYVALSQTQEAEKRTISFQHSQFGLAAMYLKALSPNSDFSVIFRYHGLGGASTGIVFEAAYEGIFAAKQKWGASFLYSNQSATATNGSSTFNQMGLAATLSF
ncbi:MAG: hypothetical protein KF681_17205 [Bdellovibrionaceae bacterium]|nr:hypothetical protein [Pseudobdellovibrionaceae bacterium]